MLKGDEDEGPVFLRCYFCGESFEADQWDRTSRLPTCPSCREIRD